MCGFSRKTFHCLFARMRELVSQPLPAVVHSARFRMRRGRHAYMVEV